jgi:glutamate-1-semialdehyde aminotransferase
MSEITITANEALKALLDRVQETSAKYERLGIETQRLREALRKIAKSQDLTEARREAESALSFRESIARRQ